MPDESSSHRAKLRSAVEHLNALNRKISAWIDTHPYRTVLEIDPQTGEHVIRIDDIQERPVEISVELGEVAHALRSALDNLVQVLAGSPGDTARGIEFPVFGGRLPKASEWAKKIEGVPPGAEAIIEQLQPHHRGHVNSSDPLWRLHEIDRIDKHQRLHLVLFGYVGMGIREGTLISFRPRPPGTLKNGAEMARFVPARGPGAKMHVDLAFMFDVAFEERPPGDGLPVRPTLREIYDYVVDRVVAPLEAFVP